MSENLMRAYANNLRDYKNEAYVFESLFQMYGDRLQEWLFRHHPTAKEESMWEVAQKVF